MNIPLFKIFWNQEDIDRVTSVISKGGYWAIGPEIKEFESLLADYVGRKYAIAVNSGTSALHLILMAHGIGDGDEVIVPSFTFIATANAPQFVGATPVFAEIEESSYGLDPADVERRISSKTKAILPIDYGGSPAQLGKLEEIARKHNIILIEDASESLGAALNGKKAGSFGDSATLSFCSPKVITMGEGGAVLTDSKDIYEKVKLMYNHGRAETTNYFSSTEQMEYVMLGYNFRMSTMAAALGIGQMNKLDEIIRMRRDNARYLTEKLSGIECIAPPQEPEGDFRVYQMYTIRLKGKDELRNALKNHLVQSGISAKVYFDPVHLSLFYRNKFGYNEGDLPITEKISREVLTLPMYPELSVEDMDFMADQITAFIEKEQYK